MMKKRSWMWVGIAQAVLFVALAIILAFPTVNKTFGFSDFERMLGQVREDAVYTDDDLSSSGWFVSTPKLRLGFGVYRITVEYESTSDDNLFYFTSESVQNSEIRNMDKYHSDNIYLEASKTEQSMEIYVNIYDSDYYIGCIYGGTGSLAIKSITIHKTAGGTLKGCLIYLLLVAVTDLLIVFADRKKRGIVKNENVNVFFALAVTVIFSSLPLFVTFMIKGHDVLFHLARIESIKDAMLAGEFPIKIYSDWLCGNGYASGVYYGDALLYIPAVLRMMGFNLMQSYNIFIFLCNLSTCVISYFCFKGISKSKVTAVIGAALYTTSIYRLIDIYIRSAVGEYAAMVFIPLTAYGLYKIYTEDTQSDGYSRNWIIPVIGFTGIINSHILTCEMVGVFTILLCIVLFKRTFEKKRFIVLVKTALYTCIAGAGFLVPFIQYFIKGGIVATDVDRFYTGIQQYGAYLTQIFEPFTTYSGLTPDIDSSISAAMPVNAGAALGFGAIVLIYVLVMGYVKEKKERVAAWISLAFAALSVWMSTCLFPWNAIKSMSGRLGGLYSNYPWRFLSIASIMLVLCIVIALKSLHGRKLYIAVAAVLLGINALQSAVLLCDIVNNAEPYRVYQADDIDTMEAVIGAEYLPCGIPLQVYSEQYAIEDDNIIYIQNYRDNNYVDCNITNDSNHDGSVIFSMVYYDGYTAVDKDTGGKLEVYMDDGRVALRVKAGYSGNVIVRFAGFTSWKIAGIVSIIACLFLMLEFADAKSHGKIRSLIMRVIRIRNKN